MKRTLFLVAWLSFTLTAADHPPAWPQFRGPGGTGIAADSDNPPLAFGPGRKMIWKVTVPAGHSSPSIWGDRIFLTAFNKESKTLEVLSADRKTGKILWRRPVPAEKIETVHEISSPATATPVVDGERVYAYFGSSGLICFDFEGNQKWSVPLGVANAPFGSGTSPILSGDLLILSRDEGKDPYLLALDRRTGATVWKTKQNREDRPGGSFHASTPVLWKDEVVVHRRGEVVGFDLKTGARKWWVTATTQGTGNPGVGPEAIYVGTWFNFGEPDLRVPLPGFDTLLKQYDKNSDGVLSAEELPDKIPMSRRIEMTGITGADMNFSPKNAIQFIDTNKDGKVDRTEWETVLKRFNERTEEHGLLAIRPMGAGDVTATSVLWKEPRAVPEVPTPLYYKDRVYAVTNGGIVSCLDAHSGKLIFRGRVGPGGAYLASPVAASGKIYFTSVDGVISVIQAGDKFEVLARNDFQESIFATPAIVGNAVYVRTLTQLYAFGN